MFLLKKNAFKLFDRLQKNHQHFVQLEYRKLYDFADSFRFNGHFIKIYGNGKLIAGEQSYIGDYSTIQLSKDNKVVIGNRCSISHNVRIYTSSKLPDYDFSNKSSVPSRNGDVIIKELI